MPGQQLVQDRQTGATLAAFTFILCELKIAAFEVEYSLNLLFVRLLFTSYYGEIFSFMGRG